MKKLVINTDDFGLSRGINYSIIEGLRNGIVTSTTAMVMAPDIAHARDLALENPSLGVGCHLCLTAFTSLSKHPQITTSDDEMFKLQCYYDGKEIDEDVIYKEWDMQIGKFIQLFGKKPTHLDTHHHMHMNMHSANSAMKKIAKKYDVPVRNMNISGVNATLSFEFYGETVSEENFKKFTKDLLKEDGFDIYEMCVHNAFLDVDLLKLSSYNEIRMVEHKIINSKSIKDFISSLKVKLTNFEVR